MSLSDILGSALSGLNASQAGLRAGSSNIANVSTPGYARERVAYSTQVTAGRNSGVRAGEAERVADRFLEANVFRRAGDFGRAQVVGTYLDRLQSLLGAPGAEFGLPARIDAIGAAAIAMTGSAATDQTVRAFTGTVQDALQSLDQLGTDVSTLQADVATEVRGSVDRINDLLGRIHTLNENVSRLTAAGRSSSGANQQRMGAVEELAGLLRITTREQSDGRLVIDTASGATLVDRRPRLLDYPIGDGADQPVYPVIAIRFAEEDGSLGAATGELLDSPVLGGKLGGLLDLRDHRLPQFERETGLLVRGLAEALNAVTNTGSTVPPPPRLNGGQTGMALLDRLGFAGRATFAVVGSNGALVASTTVDFDALGPSATIGDAVGAINAGLGGAASATFSNGRLTIASASGTNGVVVAQDPANPSSRAEVGFSHFFGLNDLVTAPAATLTPSGLLPSDPHGFATGESIELVLRDWAGRTLGSHSLAPTTGGSFGDLLADLNGGPLSGFGSFALDGRGRLAFTPGSATPQAVIAVPADSSNRFGTGRSFSSLLDLTTPPPAAVRADLAAAPQRLPLAQLNLAATAGQVALGAGDRRGASLMAGRLGALLDLGAGGTTSVERLASELLGGAGADSAHADELLTDATARRDDAVARRDSFSGVNIDEELAQLVVLQNSYSAAARVLSTATEMYDTLLSMVR